MTELGAAGALDERPDDVAARVRLAASAATPAEMLCRLATDRNVLVRAAVALNQHAPEGAEARLASDPDGHVRALLGSRLAALYPEVGADEQPALYERLSRTLEILVHDEMSRVREAVACVLKDMAAAPRGLILHLARDEEVTVREPVLRLSPVLTTDDLLELLAERPAAAAAIAGRCGLADVVCDAVAASADDMAIRTLLENHSADIREATLDRLVQQSAAHIVWHAPLVRRPALSERAARALANIVARDLLESLAARDDLAPGLIAELQVRLEARGMDRTVPRWPEEDPDVAAARRFAEGLRAHGRLNDEALACAAQRGQKRLTAALLAVAADVADCVVQRAVMLRSAKAVISLMWQGGFSARHGRAVQVLLCQIPPAAALVGAGAARFPLREEEMRWQLAFLANTEAAG
jgi:uncharacterized protein (DUF2336 family)